MLGLAELSAEDVRHVLRTAEGFEGVSGRSVKKVPALRGRVVVNLFFEDSTRTRASFNLAASRLSADVLEMTSKGSSVSKGESLTDTARTIEAMGVDAIVCRHHLSGAAVQLAKSVGVSVINAGDGQHEHPTQGLLDAFTIATRKGRRGDYDLSGLRVGIVGDVAHSRVARSNIHALTKLGAEVVVIGPATLAPRSFESMGCAVADDFDAALPTLDVVNMLRVQHERMSGPAFPSVREYVAGFGLTEARMARAKGDVLVMHPGPLNRGVEIVSSVADGERSAILEQVGHGLSVRMAVLFLCVLSRGG